MNDKYAVFGNHAKDRLKEFNIRPGRAYWLFYNSEKDELPKDIRKYKQRKYGGEDIRHSRNGTIIFTYREQVDRETGEKMYFILTVYDQNIDVWPK